VMLGLDRAGVSAAVYRAKSRYRAPQSMTASKSKFRTVWRRLRVDCSRWSVQSERSNQPLAVVHQSTLDQSLTTSVNQPLGRTQFTCSAGMFKSGLSQKRPICDFFRGSLAESRMDTGLAEQGSASEQVERQEDSHVEVSICGDHSGRWLGVQSLLRCVTIRSDGIWRANESHPADDRTGEGRTIPPLLAWGSALGRILRSAPR